MDREEVAQLIFKRLRAEGYDMGRHRWNPDKEEWLQLLQIERNVFLFLARDIIEALKGGG